MLRCCCVVLLSMLSGCSKTASGPESSEPAAGPQQPLKELIFNTYHPPQDAVRLTAVEDFARRLEQESAGALKVTVPNASLATPTNQWSLVTEGVADLAIVPVYTHRVQLTLPMLADLPLNSMSGEAASIALWNTQRKYFDKANEFAEVKLLALYALPPYQFISNVKPIHKIEDFKGTKIWVSAGPPTEAVKLVGGIPVYSQYSQLFEYASKGTVDALMIGPGTIKQASIGEHVQYMTEIPGGMGSASFAVVMNKAAFDSLGEAEQSAILRAAEGLPQRVGQAVDERNRQGLAETRLTINQASPELMDDIRKRVSVLHTEWIRAAEQRGISNAAQAFEYYHEQMLAVAKRDGSTSAGVGSVEP